MTLWFPRRDLLVQSLQWKHQNSVWNLFKVNNKNTRMTSTTLVSCLIINSEKISHIFLAFPWLTLNKKTQTGLRCYTQIGCPRRCPAWFRNLILLISSWCPTGQSGNNLKMRVKWTGLSSWQLAKVDLGIAKW